MATSRVFLEKPNGAPSSTRTYRPRIGIIFHFGRPSAALEAPSNYCFSATPRNWRHIFWSNQRSGLRTTSIHPRYYVLLQGECLCIVTSDNKVAALRYGLFMDSHGRTSASRPRILSFGTHSLNYNLIIIADYYGSVIKPGLIHGDSSSPISQQTIFGWVLSGPVSSNKLASPICSHHCNLDHDLQELIARFWTQEEVTTSRDSKLIPEQEECESLFLTTHLRDPSGRYVVRLPLKSDPALLGNSKPRALASFRGLARRFSSNPCYRKLYTEFIEEYKTLGHIRSYPKAVGKTLPFSIFHITESSENSASLPNLE